MAKESQQMKSSARDGLAGGFMRLAKNRPAALRNVFGLTEPAIGA
jgi:hypothetical protein